MAQDLDVLNWQKEQYEHDQRNHFDIISLHKQDRLKHYALHFAKYAGRLARGKSEDKTVNRTCVDMLLVCLSAANTLHQRLQATQCSSNSSFFLRVTDAAGRVCDSAEKIDHFEEFLEIARTGNQDIFSAILDFSNEENIDLEREMSARRQQLAARQFYIR